MLASATHSLRCLQTHHLLGQRKHQSLHSSCLPFCQQSHMRTHIHSRPYKGNNHLSPIIQLLDSLQVPSVFPPLWWKPCRQEVSPCVASSVDRLAAWRQGASVLGLSGWHHGLSSHRSLMATSASSTHCWLNGLATFLFTFQYNQPGSFVYRA